MKSLLSLCLFVTAGLATADLPKIIGHRGASHAAPENTIAAFKLAWQEGADGIEGDFYLSSDGEVVCLHDRTTKRTAGVDLAVGETPWSTLSKLEVGAWKHERFRGEPIPRLADVLDLLPPDKFFFIEIKDDSRIVKPIREILLAKKADPKRVVLIAFDAEVIRECRKVMPEFQAHWLSSLKEMNGEGMPAKYFEELQKTGAQGFQFQATAPVSPEWLRKVKHAGYLLTSWTVNDPVLAKKMIATGVDFITTDRPAGLRAELTAATTRWNVRDHVPHEDFIIQSHRGAGELAPENSKETFELAWSLGTIPEADLRTTKDGVIVAFHDNNFARILPNESAEMKKMAIQDLTWEQISQLDIGAWKGTEFQGQRVPKLAELFTLLEADPKRRIYVDIKNVDLKQLAGEAHAAQLAARLILASTVPEVIREWKSLAPESTTLHWMGGDETALAKRLDQLAAENFASVDQLQVHITQTPAGMMPSAEFIATTGEQLRERGILFQVLPWGIKDPEMYIKLLDLGVASFATDFPDTTAEAVKHYYQAGQPNP